MAVEFENSIDLNQNEVQNMRLQQLGADPSTAVEGQIWYRNDTDFVRVNDGTRNRSLCWQDPDFIDFIPQAVRPAYLEGRAFYDTATHTLTIYNDVANTSLQVGLEVWQRVRNRTGATITDGTVVYINGATGQLGTIDKAISTVQPPSAILGMVTADIIDQAEGWVTIIGEVNDINTASLTEGAPVYLSDSVAGGYTSIKPYNAIQIGICLYAHAMHGKISISINDANDYFRLSGCVDAKDPTGFINNQNITVTYSGANRTVTLTTTDPQLYYYFNGSRKSLGTNTWTSTAHANTPGLWYLYSTDGINFTWSNTMWEFWTVQVCGIRYASSTKYIALREIHGIGPCNYHRSAHLGIGTIRSNNTPTGGTIGGYVIGSTATADRRPSATVVNLLDEDLETVVPALTDGGPYSHLYLTSSTTTDYDLNTQVEIVHMNGTTPQYQSPTTGAWSNVVANRFANLYLVAVPSTADTVGQYGRWLWMQPQAEYSTLSLAKAEDFTQINRADLNSTFAEFLPVARVTIKCSTVSYFSIEDVTQLYGSRASAAGVPAAPVTTASSVSFAPVGGISSTDVQSALAELDSEKATSQTWTWIRGAITSSPGWAKLISLTLPNSTTTNCNWFLDIISVGSSAGTQSTTGRLRIQWRNGVLNAFFASDAGVDGIAFGYTGTLAINSLFEVYAYCTSYPFIVIDIKNSYGGVIEGGTFSTTDPGMTPILAGLAYTPSGLYSINHDIATSLYFNPVSDSNSNQIKQQITWRNADNTSRMMIGRRDGIVSLGEEDFRVTQYHPTQATGNGGVRIGDQTDGPSVYSAGQVVIGAYDNDYAGIWSGTLSPGSRTNTNYMMLGNTSAAYLNGSVNTGLKVGGTDYLYVSNAITSTPNVMIANKGFKSNYTSSAVSTGSSTWDCNTYQSIFLTAQLTGARTLSITLTDTSYAMQTYCHFRQASTVTTISFSKTGITFRLSGTTTTGTNSITVQTTSIPTINAYYVIQLTWVGTTCTVSVL